MCLQVTDNQSLVLTEESLDLLTPQAMYNHILRLTRERDNMYSKWISSVCMERDTHTSECADNSTNSPMSPSKCVTSTPNTSSSNTDNNHMAVELADLKSKLRRLRQEL